MASKRIKGITIQINGDTTDLTKALSGVDSQLSKTQTALSDITRLLKFDPGNTELLEQQQRELADAVGTTRDRLKALQDMQGDMKRSLDAGDISQEQYEAYRREITETERKLTELEDKQKQFSSVVGTQMQAAGKSMQEYGDKLKGIGDSIAGVGTKLTQTITAPILGLGAMAIKTASDFDTGMSNVAAISGATGDDLDDLRDKAREMGAATKFSATEAADAFGYMAMAGWKTEDMLSGIEGIMNLAAASGEDLATTSDIVTDALTAFGLSAEDADHFADVLAAASSNANTNVSMMGETFKYAAPLAGALGFSIEDTAEAIGLMANSGLKASQAGTALRGIFSNLSGDIELSGEALGDVIIETTTADGTMRDLSDILTDLRDAFSQLSESEQASAAEALVGKNAMSGFLAIMNAGEGDVKKLSTAIANADGTAKRMANTMNDNLGGQTTILKSQIEELGISFGEIMMPTLMDVVGGAQDFVSSLNGMDDGTKKFITKAGLIAAAVGPAVTIVGKLTSGIGSIVSIAGKATGAIGGVITSLTGLTVSGGTIGLAIAGVAALAGGIIALVNNANKVPEEVLKLTEAASGLAEKSEEYGERLNDAVGDYETKASDVEYYIGRLEELERELETNGTEGKLAAEKMAEYEAIVGILNEEIPGLNATLDEQTGLLQDGTQAIKDKAQAWLDEQKAAAYAEYYSDYLKTAAKAEAELALNTTKLRREEEKRDAALKKGQDLLARQTAIKKELEVDDNEHSEAEINALREEYDTVTKALNDASIEHAQAVKDVETYQAAVDRSTATLEEHADETAAVKEAYAEMMAELEPAEEAAEAVGEAVEETGTKFVQSARDTEEYQKALEQTREDIGKTIGLFQNMDFEIDIEELQNQMLEALHSQLEFMNDYAQNLKKAAEKGVNEGLLATLSDGSIQSAQYLAAIVEMSDKELLKLNELYVQSAVQQSGEYAQALTDGKMHMIGAVDELVDETAAELDEATTRIMPSVMKTASRVLQGFSGGMKDASGWESVVTSIRSVANLIPRTANETLEIASPSRVMMRIGRYVSEGLAEGITGGVGDVEKAAEDMTDAAEPTGDLDLHVDISDSFADDMGTVEDAAELAFATIYRASVMATDGLKTFGDYVTKLTTDAVYGFDAIAAAAQRASDAAVLAGAQAAYTGTAGMVGNTTTNNTTNNSATVTPTINIYAQPGQDAGEIAEAVSEALARQYADAQAAWG